MKVRLVALDIDGTLLEPGVPVDALPADAMSRVVAQLLETGVIVVLASGRMFPGTESVAR
ncbi:MAG: HAD hydrolase family protein, partial [Gammaproteobacteria bacterium]|nr:HAD hydrolase family protein [Gammaproteobacteria bacterium]